MRILEESLSITPDSAENLPQITLVSPRAGEKQRKRKRLLALKIKVVLQSDGETEIQMPATLQ